MCLGTTKYMFLTLLLCLLTWRLFLGGGTTMVPQSRAVTFSISNSCELCDYTWQREWSHLFWLYIHTASLLLYHNTLWVSTAFVKHALSITKPNTTPPESLITVCYQFSSASALSANCQKNCVVFVYLQQIRMFFNDHRFTHWFSTVALWCH